MQGLGAAGFGSGLMQGLNMMRQRDREDTQDKRLERQDARQEQAFDLQMRRGEQQYQQADDLFPVQRETAQLGLSDARRKDDKARREEWIDEASNNAKKTLYEVANTGNIDLLNDWAFDYFEKSDGSPAAMYLPSDNPGKVRVGLIGQEDGPQKSVEMDLSEVLSNFAKNADPNLLWSAYTKSKEPTKGIAVGKDSRLVDPTNGRVLLGAEGDGVGSGGYGGLKPADNTALYNRMRGWFGKDDGKGQFVLEGDAKFQTDEAYARTMRMIEIGVPWWQAEIIARASVGGTSDIQKSKKAAEDAAIAANLKPGKKGYQEFVDKYMEEADATGVQKADAMYRQIIGSQQGVSAVSPQGFGLEPQQSGAQPPVQSPAIGLDSAAVQPRQPAVVTGGRMNPNRQRQVVQPPQANIPTINSQAEYDQLEPGTIFINPADGQPYTKR